jgi:hypothetical protein
MFLSLLRGIRDLTTGGGSRLLMVWQWCQVFSIMRGGCDRQSDRVGELRAAVQALIPSSLRYHAVARGSLTPAAVSPVPYW